MSYIDQREPPKREARHGTCTAFGGGLCGLKNEFGGGGCSLVDNDRAFRQGSICQMIPALSILSTLPDTVVLVHGAIGCGGPAHNYNASMRSRQMAETANPPGTLYTVERSTGPDRTRGAVMSPPFGTMVGVH